MKFPFLHFRHHARFLILLSFFISLLVLPPPSFVSAQTPHPSTVLSKEVSLRQQIQTRRNLPASFERDTNLVNTLNALAMKLSTQLPDSAKILSEEALKIAQNKKWDIGIANSLRQLGWFYSLQGNNSAAIELFTKAMNILEEAQKEFSYNKNILTCKAATLGNIGIFYYNQSDYQKAVVYYLMSLKIGEELDNRQIMLSNLGNIGLIYMKQSEYPKALKYYFRALKIAKELDIKLHYTINLANIGIIYEKQTDYPKALSFFFKVMKLAEELGNKQIMTNNFNSIGNIFMCISDKLYHLFRYKLYHPFYHEKI